MHLAIVPRYAAALALLFVFLSVRVIGARRSGSVAIGVAGNPDLERRARVQANFAEYAPLALLLLAMAELRGSPVWALHALCILLVIGRVSHAWGVSHTPENFRFRVGGMAATFTALLGAAALDVL